MLYTLLPVRSDRNKGGQSERSFLCLSDRYLPKLTHPFLFLMLQLSCVPPSLGVLNGTSGTVVESVGERSCAENPKYYSYMAVMSLIATAMLVQVSHLIKLGLMVLVVTATGAVNIYSWRDIYDLYDYMQFASYRCEPID